MIYFIEILNFQLSDTSLVLRLNMAAIQETHYRNVRVRRMEDDGGSSLVYPSNVMVSTVYDPKVGPIRICQIFLKGVSAGLNE